MIDYIEKIKDLLKVKGMNQSDLSLKIGKSLNTVNNYLNRNSKPDIDTFYAISTALEVPIGYFFDENPSDLRQENDSLKKEIERLKGLDLILSHAYNKIKILTLMWNKLLSEIELLKEIIQSENTDYSKYQNILKQIYFYDEDLKVLIAAERSIILENFEDNNPVDFNKLFEKFLKKKNTNVNLIISKNE
jgi:transcriptional regulator with XRE-family HTH domain